MSHFGDKNIFVSYRRDDTAGDTFQLVKALKQFIDEKRIFLDNETLQPGEDFPKVLKQTLKQCDVVLVVIGKNWLLPKPDGAPSLMNESNWVRIEVATALKQNKLVIPVLLNGTPMPQKQDLPQVVASLCNKQAKEIYYRTWDNDVKELAGFLKQTGIPFKEDERFGRRLDIVFSKWTFAILVLLSIGIYLFVQGFFDSNPQPTKLYPFNQSKTKPLVILPAGTKLARLNKNSIVGTWKSENSTGSRFYKITQTLNGYVFQILNNGAVENKGTASQKDSVVNITYEDEKAGTIEIKATLSPDGQKLTGSRSFGSKFGTNVWIKMVWVKGS